MVNYSHGKTGLTLDVFRKNYNYNYREMEYGVFFKNAGRSISSNA